MAHHTLRIKLPSKGPLCIIRKKKFSKGPLPTTSLKGHHALCVKNFVQRVQPCITHKKNPSKGPPCITRKILYSKGQTYITRKTSLKGPTMHYALKTSLKRVHHALCVKNFPQMAHNTLRVNLPSKGPPCITRKTSLKRPIMHYA